MSASLHLAPPSAEMDSVCVVVSALSGTAVVDMESSCVLVSNGTMLQNVSTGSKTLRCLLPPHISVLSPEQGVSQSEAFAAKSPRTASLHQHSQPALTPAKMKEAL